MRHGSIAKAVVLECRPWGLIAGVVRPNNKLALKVHFDDGSSMTITRVERAYYLLRDKSVGSTLPMRYDPADRAYLDIDHQALRERHARFDEGINRARVKEAEDGCTVTAAEFPESRLVEMKGPIIGYGDDTGGRDQHRVKCAGLSA